jgi:prephenate dehydrogenase
MATMARSSVTIAAVRGAIQVRVDRAEEVHGATARLLQALLATNRLTPAQVVSAIFTTTPDLHADFPAHAARQLGWTDVPLLGATEMDVPGALPRVVRVLLTLRDVPRAMKLRPVYLEGAEALRPDLAAVAKTATHARGGGAVRIAIVGLGQIGGSIGLALGERGGWERVGFDREAHVAREALRRGAVDHVATSLETACGDAQIAVVAVPVDRLGGALLHAARALPRGAVLMDTGSARKGVTQALAAAARSGVLAVGGHPIAGNEGRGLASARPDLFRGAVFALLPAGRTVPALARRLVRDLGAAARVVRPAAHDRALARTSHLPYVLSRAIESLGRAPARAGLAGPGYRSMTRLAGSDRRMAEAYVRANAREVARAWRKLRADVEKRVERLGR